MAVVVARVMGRHSQNVPVAALVEMNHASVPTCTQFRYEHGMYHVVQSYPSYPIMKDILYHTIHYGYDTLRIQYDTVI